MKKLNSTYPIVTILLMASLATYLFQIMKFQDPRNTAFYFLQDVAFLPVQIAIVTVVIGKILNHREKKERLKKTNMMLSTFFSEIGNDLLEQLHKLHATPRELESYLTVEETWGNREFKMGALSIQTYQFQINCSASDLSNLKNSLSEKRHVIMLMLQNPNLLEHDTFTDLLFAVFHLTDELLCRSQLDGLPDTDLAHLNHDVLRAFRALLIHWIHYMRHLQTDYPYLFSLELRKNPFAEKKSIVIE